MDRKEFTSLHQTHDPLARRVLKRMGLSAADVDEVDQEMWADLWTHRDAWPSPAPTNPGAYIAACARQKAKMHLRTSYALKRKGIHVALEEDRTSTANMKLSRAPEAERLVEQTSLGSFLRRLADRIGGEKKQTMLDQLDNKPQGLLEEKPSAVRRGFKRMIAACRKQLGIPLHYPQTAGVDPLTHLAGVVRAFSNLDPEPSDAE